MSGRYIVKRKLLVLKWAEGSELGGAEVRCAPLNSGGYADLGGLEFMHDGSTPSPAEWSLALDVFAVHLGAWNLSEEDGSDIPACRSGLACLPMEISRAIISEWVGASVHDSLKDMLSEAEAERTARKAADTDADIMASLGVEAFDNAEVPG